MSNHWPKVRRIRQPLVYCYSPVVQPTYHSVYLAGIGTNEDEHVPFVSPAASGV